MAVLTVARVLWGAAAYEVCLEIFPDFADVWREVYVRITDLPIQDSIRDLRCGLWLVNEAPAFTVQFRRACTCSTASLVSYSS